MVKIDAGGIYRKQARGLYIDFNFSCVTHSVSLLFLFPRNEAYSVVTLGLVNSYQAAPGRESAMTDADELDEGVMLDTVELALLSNDELLSDADELDD